MNLSHGQGRLAGLAKQFERQWQKTSDEWLDQKRVQFEKEQVDELRRDLKHCIDSMSELSAILDTVIKKCT